LNFLKLQIPICQRLEPRRFIGIFLDIAAFGPGAQDFPEPLLCGLLMGANALPFALAFLVPFNPPDAARELSQAETALAGLSLWAASFPTLRAFD
jgi:hypothetical protein